MLGEDIFDVMAGGFVRIPRGTVHTFGRVEGRNARWLALFSPAGFEQFFVEAVGSDVSDTEAFVGRAEALAVKYDMEIVGPPLEG